MSEGERRDPEEPTALRGGEILPAAPHPPSPSPSGEGALQGEGAPDNDRTLPSRPSPLGEGEREGGEPAPAGAALALPEAAALAPLAQDPPEAALAPLAPLAQGDLALSAPPQLSPMDAAPLVPPEPEAPLGEAQPEAAPAEGRREEPKRERGLGEGALERALTAIVLFVAVTGVAWGLARPKALIAPPSEGEVPRESRAPDCRRIRFDLSELLGERWKPLAASCARGDCKSLREELIARNFPVSSWRLVDPEGEGEGCGVKADGSARSGGSKDPECARLIGRIEGGLKTLLLQVEGECQETP